MRKLLFIIAILLSFGAKAQTFTPVHNYQAPDGLDVVKYFGIPHGPTPTLNGINRAGGHPLWYNTTDSSLYIYTGNQWIIVGTGGGKNTLAGYLMTYSPNDSTLAIDTAALFNVALRKSFADSVAYRTVSFPDSTGYWEINNNGDTILTHYFVGGGGGGGGSGVDSSALHYVSTVGDTLLVLGDLYGNNDTVSLSVLNLWLRNGNLIYHNGNTGINLNNPSSALEIGSNQQSGTVALDSTGLKLTNTSPATSSSVTHLAGPIVWKSNYWFNGHNNTLYYMMAPSGTYGSILTLYWSSDGITYSPIANFSSTGNGGISFSANTTITGSLNVSSVVSSGTLYNSGFATVGSATLVDTMAVLGLVSTKQGLKYPTLTTMQRDSMSLAISSVTFTGGSGFTSAPQILANGNQTIPGTSSASFVSTVSGGAITSITISKSGNFSGTPTFGYIGGGGTGATGYFTMVQRISPGISIYCSDCTANDGSTGVNQTWNGTTWKNAW